VKLAQTVIDAFLLDYRDWDARGTSSAQKRARSAEKIGCRRGARISRNVFLRSQTFTNGFERLSGDTAAVAVSSPDITHSKRTHRDFIDETLGQLLHCASALLALAVEETVPGILVARFQGRALCEAKGKAADLLKPCQDKLTSAFTGATFNVEIEEARA
jgi:hypothetical protein